MMSHQEHQGKARESGKGAVACGIITVSDSRTRETDDSGRLSTQRLGEAGHEILRYEVVRDEPANITALVQEFILAGCQAVVLNGGTGIARRDSTFEAIDALLEKRLPGFGELFRMLSYQEIGAAAMLSRATAGLYRGAVVISLPGSPDAVRLALDALIIPELPHLVWETTRT